MKKPIEIKTTAQFIEKLSKELNLQFEPWLPEELVEQGVNSFIRSITKFERILIDTRKEMFISIDELDGNGKELEGDFDYENEIFVHFFNTASNGYDFDNIFNTIIGNIKKNRKVRQMENKVDEDGQLLLF